MKKAIATTALAALVVVSLSGCTFGLLPNSKPAPPKPQPSSEPQPEQSDDADDTADDAPETAECVGGEPVTIDADSANVEFTGLCGDVTITASSVDAGFEAAGNITITGDENSVFLSDNAGNVTIVGGELNSVYGVNFLAIDVAGEYNSVSGEAVESVTVAGSNNTISWMSGPENGTDNGNANTFDRG